MEELLTLARNMHIQESEKVEISQVIEQTIDLHKENGMMIAKLTMESVTALTASESRTKGLAQQKFLKRTWNNLTGKNKNIRVQIDADMTRVQYASQQMIQKLAEQNLLTFDLVTAVNNKLNTLVLEIDEEINHIYKLLETFFKQTRSDIIQLESRVDKLERNVDLLHWNATIEYQMYNRIEYTELPDIEKMVCLSNDFFHRTKGEWSTSDLMLLKSALSEIGLPVKSKIASKAFYNYLMEKPTIIDRLFEKISLDGLLGLETYEAPLIKGIEKLKNINGEERFLYETLATQLDSQNVFYDKRNLQLSMIHQYLLHNADMNSEVEVNLFDFVVELLVDLKMVNGSASVQEGNIRLKEADNKGDYDVFLIDFGSDKYKVIKVLSEISGISLKEAGESVNRIPATVFSRITKEKADYAKKVLESSGANVITKTYMENIQIVSSINLAGHVNLKSFIRLGEIATKGCSVASVSGNTIYSKERGKVISFLVKDGEKVGKGQPLMLILSDKYS